MLSEWPCHSHGVEKIVYLAKGGSCRGCAESLPGRYFFVGICCSMVKVREDRGPRVHWRSTYGDEHLWQETWGSSNGSQLEIRSCHCIGIGSDRISTSLGSGLGLCTSFGNGNGSGNSTSSTSTSTRSGKATMKETTNQSHWTSSQTSGSQGGTRASNQNRTSWTLGIKSTASGKSFVLGNALMGIGVEEKAASLGFGVLGRPVTADGVSEKQRINRNTI